MLRETLIALDTHKYELNIQEARKRAKKSVPQLKKKTIKHLTCTEITDKLTIIL